MWLVRRFANAKDLKSICQLIGEISLNLIVGVPGQYGAVVITGKSFADIFPRFDLGSVGSCLEMEDAQPRARQSTRWSRFSRYHSTVFLFVVIMMAYKTLSMNF